MMLGKSSQLNMCKGVLHCVATVLLLLARSANLDAQEPIRILSGFTTSIKGIAFSPDGKWLAAVGSDETMRVWSLTSGKEAYLFKAARGKQQTVAFSPDSKLIATGTEFETILWSMESGKQVKILSRRKSPQAATAVAFSPDGKMLATSGYDYKPDPATEQRGTASYTTGYTLKLWDIQSGDDVQTLKLLSQHDAVAFSPDGTMLFDEAGKIWSAETGQELMQVKPFEYRTALSMAVSPNGELVAYGDKGSIWVWSVGERKEKVRLQASSAAEFIALAFSRDGKTLASGGTNDERVQLWNLEQGIIEKRLLTKAGRATTLAFSPDGTVLASGHADGNIKLWKYDSTAPVQQPSMAREDLTALVLSGISIRDQSGNGQIEPTEKVEVTLQLENRSTTRLQALTATVQPDENVFLSQGSREKFDLGELNAGEKKSLSFSIFTNTRATSAGVMLVLRTRSAEKREPIALAFNQPQRALASVVVKGQDEQPMTFGIDVDINIPKSRQSNPHALAIIFGVEQYRSAPSAAFAKRDAEIFKEYAVRILGVPDSKNSIYLRTDEEVTRAEFEKVFSKDGWIEKRTNANSDLYIFFSGNGAPDLKDKSAYLMPNDADANYITQTGVALNALYEQLLNFKGKSITIFIDAAFSGSARFNGGKEISLFADARPVRLRLQSPVLASEKILVFKATSESQIANADKDRAHGLFTYYVLKGLRGDADANADKKITGEELETYLQTMLKKDATEQNPEVIGRNKSRILTSY
ncbi:MAG: hypothetical protein ACK41G_03745 [Candidatus Thermochlorobacter sp.]